MKGLNLQHFKKVHEDEHSATLQHPKGHQIRIAKKALNGPLKKQLSELPMQHFDSGGDVAQDPVPEQNSSSLYDSQDQTPPVTASSAPQDTSLSQDIGSGVRSALGYASDVGPLGMLKAASAIAGSQPVQDFRNGLLGTPAQADDSQVSKPTASATNYDIGMQTKNQNQPIPGGDLVSHLQGDIGQYKSGLENEARATGEEGKQQAHAAQSVEDKLQEIHSDATQKWNDLQGHYDAAIQDVKNGHIDPNHYMENKSALGKVSTAIGLILGGIGGGLLHQENPALKFLNAQIDRDVQSQKDNLGQKESVLSAYYHQFGNIRDAEQMASATQKGIYAAQLEKAAATAKDPLAQSRAQQAAAQFDMQARQQMAPLALRASLMNQTQSGKIDPSIAVRAIITDPKDRDAAFKELQFAQNHAKQSQVIMNAFDQANGTNTVAGRAFHLGFEPASVAQIQTSIMPYLKDAEGRINEQELERTDKLIPRPGDGPSKIAEKRQGLLNFLEEKASTPVLESYGIRVPIATAKPNPRVGRGYGR